MGKGRAAGVADGDGADVFSVPEEHPEQRPGGGVPGAGRRRGGFLFDVRVLI